jgi:hypothetical protein
MDPAKMPSNSGYGKRPLWQWVLLYIIIGGVIYGLVYYFVFAESRGTEQVFPYQY